MLVVLAFLFFASAFGTPYFLGISYLLSSPTYGYVADLLEAARVALEEANAQLLSPCMRNLSLLVLDDGGSEERVLANYQQFIADPDVLAVLGPLVGVQPVLASSSRARLCKSP